MLFIIMVIVFLMGVLLLFADVYAFSGDMYSSILPLILIVSPVMLFFVSESPNKKTIKRQQGQTDERQNTREQETQAEKKEKEYQDRIEALQNHNKRLNNVVAEMDSHNPFFDDELREKYIQSFQSKRLARSLANEFLVPEKIHVVAEMKSFTTENKKYKTSLAECNCRDYQTRHLPCKHMISLALFLNATYNMKGEVNLVLQSMVAEREQLEKAAGKKESK